MSVLDVSRLDLRELCGKRRPLLAGDARWGEDTTRKRPLHCDANWDEMRQGAIEKFLPFLMGNQTQWYKTGAVTYEHAFCWLDLTTRKMFSRMWFMVHAQYIPNQQAYYFRPALRHEDTSQNERLWSAMKAAANANDDGLAGLTILKRVQCTDNEEVLKRELNSLLVPWLNFFKRMWGTPPLETWQ